MVLPTVAFIVCNSALVAVTSTTWLVAPISKATFNVSDTPTFTTWFVTFAARNPALFIVRVYVPGGTFAKTYLPASFVVVVRGMFVAVSVRVAVASATDAFDGSVTVPAIVPELMFCEYRAAGTKLTKQKRATTTKTTRLLNIQPPPGKAAMAPVDTRKRKPRKDLLNGIFETPHTNFTDPRFSSN